MNYKVWTKQVLEGFIWSSVLGSVLTDRSASPRIIFSLSMMDSKILQQSASARRKYFTASSVRTNIINIKRQMQAAGWLLAEEDSTFFHHFAISSTVFVMLRVDVKHFLQAFADDITGVSCAASVVKMYNFNYWGSVKNRTQPLHVKAS